MLKWSHEAGKRISQRPWVIPRWPRLGGWLQRRARLGGRWRRPPLIGDFGEVSATRGAERSLFVLLPLGVLPERHIGVIQLGGERRDV